MAIKAHPSTGNVFRDLEPNPADAESLRIRAELMVRARQLIEGRHLTQAAAAKLFRVTQPRVSDLVRGKIDLFSIDTLIDMLARAGVRVRVTMQRSSSKAKRRAA